MKTLLCKEKRYPRFCKEKPYLMPNFFIEDVFGAGLRKSRYITEEYYTELLESGRWEKIRDDETLLIHKQLSI